MTKSNTRIKAEREFDILTKAHTDPENRPIIEPFRDEILALVDAFGNSGQSGGSAPFTAGAISGAVKKLCMHDPIGPITGIEEEWGESLAPDGVGPMQNNRCSAVFKRDDGSCDYLNAIVWSGEDEWDTFSGCIEGVKSSQVLKGFPFVPKTFYVDVTREKYDKAKHGEDAEVSGCSSGDFVYSIKDRSQLEEVWEYYARPVVESEA